MGIDENDLFYINFNEYKLRFPEIVTLPKETQMSRYDYFEKRRQEKIEVLKNERENLTTLNNNNSKSLSKCENGVFNTNSKFSQENPISNVLNDQLKSFEKIKKKQVYYCNYSGFRASWNGSI